MLKSFGFMALRRKPQGYVKSQKADFRSQKSEGRGQKTDFG